MQSQNFKIFLQTAKDSLNYKKKKKKESTKHGVG